MFLIACFTLWRENNNIGSRKTTSVGPWLAVPRATVSVVFGDDSSSLSPLKILKTEEEDNNHRFEGQKIVR